jgi:two-component system alkaline phosphatase synthesis response regulator PhoP
MKEKAAILVVDDDPDIRDSVAIILKNHNYIVHTASNGKEAVQALEEKKPDLMILDIMMATDTEGFDLAYDLREKTEFKNLPIIMLTSFLEKVRAEGPGDFAYILGEQWPAQWLLEKPLDTKKLLDKIEAILKERS